MSDEAKFSLLRDAYVRARAQLDEYESTLARKHGSGWRPYWLKASEEKSLNSKRDAAHITGRKFYDHLAAISPRDWSYGVPIHWLYEHLTYEDAVRPVDEPLSVVPPLSYGATVHRT